MKKTPLIILITFFTVHFFTAKAQHLECATDQLEAHLLNAMAHPELEKASIIERISTWREQNPGSHAMPDAPMYQTMM